MSVELIRKYTLSRILNDTVKAFPDNEALIHIGHNYRQTWTQFAHHVDAMANGLMALGIKKGEKIALWATNVPNWIALMFASAKIGATLLAINTNYRDRELSFLLKQSDCENFVCIDGFLDYDYTSAIYRVIPNLKKQDGSHVRSDLFPRLRRVISLSDSQHKGMLPLSYVLELGKNISDEEYSQRQNTVNPDDVVMMQYTSGTTGTPKGVMLSHTGIGNNGRSIGDRQELSEKDRVIIPVPLFHCFGCVLGVMACVTHGSCMVITESFSPEKVIAAIQNEKCTSVYGVPSNFVSILGHSRFNQYDISSLRVALMSGAICPEHLLLEVKKRMHLDSIVIPYGLTEASPVMTMTGISETEEHSLRSVGKSLPGITVSIKNPTTHETLPIGTEGEICCHGYNVMKGYYNMPDAVKEVIDKEGWLHSGDLGKLDEDGYLYVTGRIKDMIVRGGENIYPKEIEEFLLQMPEVAEIQVVGIPSRRYGEDVAAFIILRENCTLRAEDVRRFCRGRIAWHKIPRYIALVDDFPKTASGKIQKYKLREMADKYFPNIK